MKKRKKNPIVIAVVVSSLYLLSCLVIGIIATLISLQAFFHNQFSLSITSASIAKGALLPYSSVSKNSPVRFFIVWDKGLNLIKSAPSFMLDVKTLHKSYQDRSPLDTALVTRTQQQYSTLLYQWGEFQQLITQSKLASALVAKTQYQTIADQLSRNAQLLLLSDSAFRYVATQLQNGETVQFLLLFQNNMELRPTGGFPGSYATLTLASGQPIKLEVEDIYVPDGQLEGHVDPPLRIQEAFQQGFWKLRDANWHPDFQQSMERVQWFFSQAGYPKYDGIIAINFSSIQELLGITGTISAIDLSTNITQSNIYHVLQRTEEPEFFAGSTQKKDTLSAFSTALLLKLQTLSPTQYLDILDLMRQQLDEKNLLFSLSDPDLMTLATHNHWDGRLTPVFCSDSTCSQDYFSIFEANLGVNKSNCCVSRSVSIQKDEIENKLHTATTITYHLDTPPSELKSVVGHYKAFVRVYFPSNTTLSPPVIGSQTYTEYIRSMKAQGYLHPITSEGYSWGDVSGLKELGLWVVVPIDQTLTLTFETDTPFDPNQQYSLMVQKQPGTLEQFSEFSIRKEAQQLFSSTLKKDELFP